MCVDAELRLRMEKDRGVWHYANPNSASLLLMSFRPYKAAYPSPTRKRMA